MISSSSFDRDPFARSPLTTICILFSQKIKHTVSALLDTGATGYSFIDEEEAQFVCTKLGIQPVPLAKPRPLRGYDGQLAGRPITHAIYPSLDIEGHTEVTVPMLITRLGNHKVILGKPWMNTNGILLDMRQDKLIFPRDQQPLANPKDHEEVLPKTTYVIPARRTIPVTILQRPLIASPPPQPPDVEAPLPLLKPIKKPTQLDIAPISAGAFYKWSSCWAKAKGAHCFSLTISQIDKMLLAKSADGQDPDKAVDLAEISTQTSEDIRKKLPSEYHDFLDVFDKSKADILPPHRSYDHKIELEANERPPHSRIYPMSGEKLQKVREYLEENLQKGFISPSTAPYASPVLFVQKPNGGLRFCVDYRKLNAITRRNRYPIPLIDETLARVVGCKYITKLDIIAAFNKLRMHPDSEEYTTFVTSLGAYKYHVLPFGLTNGPSNYQHYMNDVLFDFINKFCQAYLDDILIYSKTKKDHVNHVRLVLAKLRQAGLQVDIQKCEFHVQETAFLGVILSTEGLQMDPKKIQAVTDWPIPTTLKQVQGFIGFCNFYRRFIKDFSKIVRPMMSLTHKDTAFNWSPNCQSSFGKLKDKITSAPVLRHFDRSKKAVLETDSSDYVNGGVLSQEDEQGVLHPVAFYSKNMLPAECNYEIYDKELLAIIRCFEHWRPELESTDIPVEVITDHKGLEYFMSTKELSRRQARWSEKLAEYNFKIRYRPGRKNERADALTRMPGSTPESQDDERVKYQQQTILTPDRLVIAEIDDDTEKSIHQKVLDANRSDENCSTYRKAIQEKRTGCPGVSLQNCSVRDGVLYKQDVLWVPNDERLLAELIGEVHNPPASGHPGINRTVDLLRRHYYWPGMQKEVLRFVRNCHTCQRSKAPRDKYNGLLHPLSIPDERWRDISIDFVTGLPEVDGRNAILTVVDRLSKERHYIACTASDEGTSAESTAELLIEGVFRLHGLPNTIVSDRGPQFTSDIWKSFCKRLNITSKLSTAFHPETDGQTERANQDVERQLRTYCSYMQNDWLQWLPIAEFADNNATSATTGLTPFFANKGFHPRMSFGPDPTTYDSTRARLQAAKAEDIAGTMSRVLEYMRTGAETASKRMAEHTNKTRKDVIYRAGDLVFLSSRNITTARPSKKLDDKMLGPFKVIGRKGHSYELQLPATMKIHNVFHPSLLRKAAEDPLLGQKTAPPQPIIVDGTDQYEVDDILDAKLIRGRLKYRVKWRGYEDRDLDWYNADDGEFDSAADVVAEFHKKNPWKPGPATTTTTAAHRLRSNGNAE